MTSALSEVAPIRLVSDTIEPLIDDFVSYLRRNGRADTYLAEVERSLRRYFSPLHRFNAGDINRAMVAKLLATIRTDRGPIAADRSRAHLSKFFTWMISEGLAEVNPVSGTNRTGSKARERVLQDFELLTIWNALGSDDYGDTVRLLILTGARRDEIGSLLRGEINIAQKQIELPGSRSLQVTPRQLDADGKIKVHLELLGEHPAHSRKLHTDYAIQRGGTILVGGIRVDPQNEKAGKLLIAITQEVEK